MSNVLVKLHHQAFRTLLSAVAMPGTSHQLPPGVDANVLLDAVYEPPRDGVIVVRTEITPEVIAQADRGTALVPERGATLVLIGDRQTPSTPARLNGPGIREPSTFTVPLSREAIAERARACAEYPLGIDIIAIDGVTVRAFPRTTRIEVC
jgi:phosphonate C-P lyase system protein PhnH